MRLTGKRIGFALTGSHCTLEEVFPSLEELVREGAAVTPIWSPSVAGTATRFGKPDDWSARLESITGRRPLETFAEVEPIGPLGLLDCLVVAPCTGNTLAKLANAITDTPVVMAAKAQLRNLRPVVLAVSTNDGLGLNARNLGTLLAVQNIYFVPFGQDNPTAKPNSLGAEMGLLVATVEAALAGRQLQPVLRAVFRAARDGAEGGGGLE